MKILVTLLLITSLYGCQKETEYTGVWRGVLQSPGGELPFGLAIDKNKEVYSAKILNGEEQVDTSSMMISGDEMSINFSWFDAKINARLKEGKLVGQWTKTTSGQNKTSSLPFVATIDYHHRFIQEINHAIVAPVTGSWKVVFSDKDGDSKAIAEFSQEGQIVSGTFLTATGDYRYLSGVANDGQLLVSTFDGAHAFLFTADVEGDEMTNGHFWSRDSYHATWKAKKSDDISGYLQNSWQMNKAIKKVEFSFQDINKNIISLTDARFKNKPVLVNLFGTWCPNCNDEAPVLAKLYDKYNSKGLEVVGLAFEFTEDKQRDLKQLEIFKKRHGINYPLLLAGGNDKSSATKTLGFLDEVKSYPTTLFLNSNHEVVKINTGFSGPGTGEHYIRLVKELEDEILNLLE